ncbi:MAG TPA: SDR family oxidoreductase [Planctomycetaceae bacterium]|nr:SDR family oxidoreductase [Planctomycetaceae bacterium]
MVVKERIALVTGAGRGIGRAIAIGLAQDGVDVALTARTEAELQEVAQLVEQQGRRALCVVADLSSPDGPRQILEQTEPWGVVNILVNNAGIGSSHAPQPLLNFDDDYWHLTMALNVTAPYLLTKCYLPGMIEQGWGRLINIASINAKVTAIHGAAYTVSKHALAGLTKSTAVEVVQEGITANAVCPGVTRTAMNDKRLQYDEQRTGTSFADLEKNASPLGRRMVPEEMAALAVFLATEGASGINGQLLNVCGGRVLAA